MLCLFRFAVFVLYRFSGFASCILAMYWHFSAYLYRFRSLCCYFRYSLFFLLLPMLSLLLLLLLLCGCCFQFCCNRNAFFCSLFCVLSLCCSFLAISSKRKSWKVFRTHISFIFSFHWQCIDVCVKFIFCRAEADEEEDSSNDFVASVFGMHLGTMQIFH